MRYNGESKRRQVRHGRKTLLLRTLLGETPLTWNGTLGHTGEAMEVFIRLSGEIAARHPEKAVRFRTYAVWGQGLLRSLEELEESLFAARYFAARIQHHRWAELSPEEKADYNRHVYFDKNAYIRMFSLLDKLGTLLNDVLELRTEKIKMRFSYFTVLRSLRESGRHRELEDSLNALKERHRGAMNRLRLRRNMEIHYMNAELQDDLNAGYPASAAAGDGGWLENLPANMADSEEGWNMVLESLGHSLRFAAAWMRRLS
jgi:hypothetical protein